jgi:DHA2 family multidrug resistance protein
MALFSVAVMVGPAFGPTLGGWIVDNYHWSWIFFINLPVGALGFFMVWKFVEEPEDVRLTMKAEAARQRRNMDWLGIALLWTTLIALQFLLEEGQSHDWFESNLIIGMALVSVFGTVAFIVRELSAPAPAVNLRLFTDRTFATGTLVSASVMSILMSGMFLLPLFMQELLGFTAMQSGLALMPRTLVMVFVMPLVGKFYNKFPAALFAAVGLLLAAYGQYMLSALTLQSTARDVWGSIVLQGVGMSMLFVPLSTLSLSTVSRHQLSDATGLSSLLRQIGGSMGLAVLSTLLTRYTIGATEALKWQVSPDRPEVAQALRAAAAGAVARGMDPVSAQGAALASLAGRVAREGAVIGFEKTLAVGAILFLAVSPLVLLLRAPKSAASAPPVHVEIEA